MKRKPNTNDLVCMEGDTLHPLDEDLTELAPLEGVDFDPLREGLLSLSRFCPIEGGWI